MPTSSLLRHLLFLLLLLLGRFDVSLAGANVTSEFIYPGFTATNLLFIDSHGIFLSSPKDTFALGILNPGGQQFRFYLSIVHSPTSTVVWTANRDVPVKNDGAIRLNSTGFTLFQPDGSLVWSTPKFSSPISKLQLLDNGNLVALDASGGTLWQSFDHPIDTIVPGQVLNAGSSLVASINGTYPAIGDYSFTLTPSDALMLWKSSGQIYYSLSTDLRAFQVYDGNVAYMAVNSSGLYLFSAAGLAIFQVSLPPSDFRIVKMDSDGRFHVQSYSAANASAGLVDDFVAPSSKCGLPFTCMTLGLCMSSGAKGMTCSCPPPLAVSSAGGCMPADGSTLASTNSSSCAASATSYITLASGVSYFSIPFSIPATTGGNMSACQSFCTNNCSCLGVFYKSSTKSCYLIEDLMGSLYSSTSNSPVNIVGYVKTIVSSSSASSSNNSSSNHLAAILSPAFASLLFVIVVSAMAFLLWRRKKASTVNRASIKEINHGRRSNAASPAAEYPDDELEEEDDILGELIPGLPTRFTYDELEAVTNSFRVKVGSGGFGSVYKGELPDKSLVAVKKIENIGVQGKREFCTEIGTIGNVHHVNLVRLRGFCLQGGKRLLVYEFMNRGSLDRPLFGSGPPLEWKERVDIAIGAARGLAYLHSDCRPKIIHCDVKPENILLQECGPVKIADFGLAKLLTAEQSGIFTTMRGTRGYLAPEWLTNSAISDRTDVYSFGMVLLELVRGRKNRSSRTDEEDMTMSSTASGESGGGLSKGGYFPLVALQAHEEGRYLELADPRLEWRVTEEEVEKMVKVALCCLHEEPPLRPNMMTVAGMLEGNLEVWEPRGESLNFLRLYGKRFVDKKISSNEREKLRNIGSKDTMWLLNSPTSSSALPSYISSQQISGPR